MLGADILLSGEKLIDANGALLADSAKLVKWTPIGNKSVALTGNFDGDGHSVSGIFINTTSSHNGLFGSSEGTVSNVTVKNSWIQGGSYTAGIVGYNEGAIENTDNEAAVVGTGECTGGVAGQTYYKSYNTYSVITDVKNSGVISGQEKVGGIVGCARNVKMDGTVNTAPVSGKDFVAGNAGSCGGYEYIYSNSGELSCSSLYIDCSSVSNAKNTGTIEGKSYVAGILGAACRGTVEFAANTVKISGADYSAGIFGYSGYSTSENLYNLGKISGGKYVGGIIGYNQEGVTSSAYSTAEIHGDSLAGLLVGYNYNTTMKDYYYVKYEGFEAFGQNNGGGSATAKTKAEMQSADFAKLLGDDWIFDSAQNNGFPTFKE